MALLSDSDRRQVQEMLGRMSSPVRLVFFTQTLDCDSCVEARRILEEIVPLSDLLGLEEYNFVLDKDPVALYQVPHVPAIAVVGNTDTGIRFYGAPSGYEFMALLDAILMVSSGESGLSEETRTLLAGVTQPVAIQVFSTPT